MTAPSSSGSGSTPDGDSTGPSPSLLKSVQARAASAAAGTPLLRAVFMGTPAFAAIILKAMLESRQLSLAAVFTQPDRPAGRGKRQCPPPVKLLAVERGLPVFQPPHFRPGQEGDAAVASLAALEPDVLLVAAYGLILPQRVLDIPRLMAVNVHASLLPRHRCAAPIQRAVMAGDNVTGVSIMRMEAGLDTGPLLLQRAVGIDINDTSATLHDELAREGAGLLELALERLRAGALQPFAQDNRAPPMRQNCARKKGSLIFPCPCGRCTPGFAGLSPGRELA